MTNIKLALREEFFYNIELSRKNLISPQKVSVLVPTDVLKAAYEKYKKGDVNDYLEKIHLYADIEGFLLIKSML